MFQCQIFVTKSPAYTPTNWYLKFSKIWSMQKDAEIILTKKIDLRAVMVKITGKPVNTFSLKLTYITCIKTL